MSGGQQSQSPSEEENVDSDGIRLGKGFIAVHVGAGYHSPANSELYKQICREACLQAVLLLREKKSALEAIIAAMVALEDSPWTNAGTGSNLTVTGTVECDASIMDGNLLQYGAVGGMSGVKNPILVAESLLQTQLHGNLSLGRIPPSTLVGPGARDWAIKKGIPVVPSDALITDASKKAFIKHKRKLDMLEEGGNNHKLRRTGDGSGQVNGTDGSPAHEVLMGDSQEDQLYDTVGAVCMDHRGNVVSAVSSGGIVLKQPGRLGQAAMFGCGCWAENEPSDQSAVGISTSGCGEHLTKALLARECAECLKGDVNPTEALNQVFQKKFLKSPFLRTVNQKLGGALALKLDYSNKKNMEVEVLWAHTTDSMCLAYMSTEQSQPKALVSRLPEGSKCGKSCVVQSKTFHINVSQSKSKR